jgi:hypothetical protein
MLTIEENSENVERLRIGILINIPWLGDENEFCRSSEE